ncbi:MAG: serine/threonine-protein kinase, partial [Planctomycetia bacterium]|nr:serine/threonine-protein kinase [Planctomycetia bacterium]
HRDLKPANVLSTPDGKILLTDFGIARMFGAENETIAGAILGTAEYMSPEQARGDPLDHRTDIYAAGGVLYRLIAGRPPLLGRNVTELLRKQRDVTPDPLSTYSTALPPELDQLTSDLLEKDPAQRPPGAMALSRRLTEILTQYEQLDFPPFRPPQSPTDTGGVQERGVPTRMPENANRHEVNVFSAIPQNTSSDTPGLRSTPGEDAANEDGKTLSSSQIYHFDVPTGVGEEIPFTDPTRWSAGTDQTVPADREIYGLAQDVATPSAESVGNDETRGFDLHRDITMEPSATTGGVTNGERNGNGGKRKWGREREKEEDATGTATRFQREVTRPAIGGDADVTLRCADAEIQGRDATAHRPFPETENQYRVVRDEERDRLRLTDESVEHVPAWKMPQTWILFGVFLCIVAGALWSFRPVSADRLAAQIDGIAGEETDSGIPLRAEEPIRTFLTKFPDDPRVGTYRKYLEEMELFRLERQLEWRTRSSARRGEPVTALENEYLRAVTLAKSDPATGVRRFQSLTPLYASCDGTQDRDGKCYELVKRQLEKYTGLAQRQSELERAELERQLAEVAGLREKDP